MVVPSPKLSIITAFYDRIECLKACLASVAALNFRSYEHIVVSDGSPLEIVNVIQPFIRQYPNADHWWMMDRTNDWGVGPSNFGLHRARGEYVAFLNDDNGYLPHHFDKLIKVLDGNKELGFAYSSALYGKVGIIGTYPPVCGQVDMGQMLFRRELFSRYFPDEMKFTRYDWDCELIDIFLAGGEKCEWVPEATFIYRLAMYPELMA